jgi:hypothetical protein
MTSLSQYFMATDVSATGISSFTVAFLTTWTMLVCLKRVGNTEWVGEMLKMSVKTLNSWSVQEL